MTEGGLELAAERETSRRVCLKEKVSFSEGSCALIVKRLTNQHIISASGDGERKDLAVEVLNPVSSDVSVTSKDHGSLTSAELKVTRGENLGETRLGSSAKNRLEPVVTAPLGNYTSEGERLEVSVHGLDVLGHVGELLANDRLLLEKLAKSLAATAVGDRLSKADTGVAVGLDRNAKALTNKVAEQDSDVSDQVVLVDLDIIKLNESGPGSLGTHAVHGAGRESRELGVDQEEGKSTHSLASSTGGDDRVVRKHSTRNPLLVSVDHVIITLLDGGGSEVSDIGSSLGLRHSQADLLVSANDSLGDTVSHLVASVVDDRADSNLFKT